MIVCLGIAGVLSAVGESFLDRPQIDNGRLIDAHNPESDRSFHFPTAEGRDFVNLSVEFIHPSDESTSKQTPTNIVLVCFWLQGSTFVSQLARGVHSPTLRDGNG